MYIKQIQQTYIDKVKTLDIVRDISIQGNIVTTIIEAPPYEDSYRKPIYQAQIEAYRQLEPEDRLDFWVHNILEEKR